MAFRYIRDPTIDNIAAANEAEVAAMEKGFADANHSKMQSMGAYADAGVADGALEGAKKLTLQGNVNDHYNYETVLTADPSCTI